MEPFISYIAVLVVVGLIYGGETIAAKMPKTGLTMTLSGVGVVILFLLYAVFFGARA